MKLTARFAFLAAALALVPATGFAQSGTYIPLISKGFQHQFWQAVKVGAEKAAKDYKVTITFEGPESETMVDKQIDMLSAVLAKNPKALGFAALDSEAAAPLLKKAQAAHIPVIGFDSGVKSDIPVTTCATDNLAAAALAADKMAELIGKSGEVAVIAADQTGKSNIDRRDGFVGEMKKKYPNIKVVDIQYGGDILQASEATKSIILAHPNLKGIFGANEGCANGVANGIKELGRAKKLVAIGFDSGKAQIDNVKSGLLAGAITQNPVGMGYKTVEAAVKALKGEKLPKVIDTGFFYYDASNYTKPEIAAVLYQ
jgi:ribose transport system substrate-binding protein